VWKVDAAGNNHYSPGAGGNPMRPNGNRFSCYQKGVTVGNAISIRRKSSSRASSGSNRSSSRSRAY
jgi:hypothetical protein